MDLNIPPALVERLNAALSYRGHSKWIGSPRYYAFEACECIARLGLCLRVEVPVPRVGVLVHKLTERAFDKTKREAFPSLFIRVDEDTEIPLEKAEDNVIFAALAVWRELLEQLVMTAEQCGSDRHAAAEHLRALQKCERMATRR